MQRPEFEIEAQLQWLGMELTVEAPPWGVGCGGCAVQPHWCTPSMCTGGSFGEEGGCRGDWLLLSPTMVSTLHLVSQFRRAASAGKGPDAWEWSRPV